MYTISMRALPGLKIIFSLFMGFEIISTSLHVKERKTIKILKKSYLTLIIKILKMYLHPSVHTGCVFEPKASVTLRYSTYWKIAHEE